MPYEYKVRRRVEFSETDMAGIVHYSNFFRHMEAAEHAFFRSLGYSVVTTQTDPPRGWPRGSRAAALPRRWAATSSAWPVPPRCAAA